LRLAFALLATTGASIAATKYDQSNAASIKTVVLGDHPSFVDEAGVGPTALLLLARGQDPRREAFLEQVTRPAPDASRQ
jgi:hypothetical protein